MSKEDTARQIGKLAPEDAERDAIHVAVVPIVAGEILTPGQRVGLYNGEARRERYGYPFDIPFVGVVDPYLTDYVVKGNRFFLFLPPGSITSLKHVWTHPAFDHPEKQDPNAAVASAQHVAATVAYYERKDPHATLQKKQEVVADSAT